MATKEEVAKKVIEIFTKVVRATTQRDLSGLARDTELQQLNLGSVVIVEILGSIEVEFGIEFPNERLGTLLTIDDLIALTEELCGPG